LPTVDFHTGLTDKLGYACRLLRKVLHNGKTVVVTGAPAELARLDPLLWTFEPGEFIAHVRLRSGESPPERLARTPVWLAERPGDAPGREVLVNLGPAPATATEAMAFDRVLELVGSDDTEVAAGRQRWRAYRLQGIEPRNHSLAT
jgi:DNA polymerase-3 subunit chi